MRQRYLARSDWFLSGLDSPYGPQAITHYCVGVCPYNLHGAFVNIMLKTWHIIKYVLFERLIFTEIYNFSLDTLDSLSLVDTAVGLGFIFPVQTLLSVNKYLVVTARPQFDISRTDFTREFTLS